MFTTVHALADACTSTVPISRRTFSDLLSARRGGGGGFDTMVMFCAFAHRHSTKLRAHARDPVYSLPVLESRHVNDEIKSAIFRNPHGMMRAAMKLRNSLSRTSAVTALALSKNDLRKRCLGEPTQRVRTELKMGRDNSNNRTSYLGHWKSYLTAKEQVLERQLPLQSAAKVEKRVRSLVRKMTRPLRNRNNPINPTKRAPRWRTAPRFSVTDKWIDNKLTKWCRRERRSINPSNRLRATKRIRGMYYAEERKQGRADLRVLTIGTWNVDKNRSHFHDAIVAATLPAEVDLLLVSEASTGLQRKPVLPPKGWTSSTVKHCQVLVRSPGTMQELAFPQPTWPAATPTDGVVDGRVDRRLTALPVELHLHFQVRGAGGCRAPHF